MWVLVCVFVDWMDEGGLNMKNWTYYEQQQQHYNKPAANLNLHLFPSMDSRRIPVPRPFLGRENPLMINHHGAFNPMVSESSMHMDPVRESWVNSRERYVQQMMAGNTAFGGFHEHPATHSLQLLQQQQQQRSESPKEAQEDVDVEVEVEDRVTKRDAGSSTKKRQQSVATPKPPKAKKPKKSPSIPKENGSSSNHRVKAAKKNMDVVINGMDLDIASIPIPVCSCTGSPQQCYRWGCGGWQSACCTTTISMYPLPMSTKRRGARIAGRKMSQGAFKKVLEKLVSENYDFGNAIDLKTHWAKHGTNKFVTIR